VGGMFEERAAAVLQTLLGDYVHGLDADALRISVWRGDIVLRNLRLRPEALLGFGLPFDVQAGLLGELTMKVPWTALGKEPVVLGIDRVFCLARSDSGGDLLEEEEAGEAAAREARRQRLAATEKTLVLRLEERMQAHDGKGKDVKGTSGGGGVTGSKYVQTILGNLQLRITNIHIRFEEPERGSPFAFGLTLAELSAVSVNEDGEEAFISSGALERLRKSARLSCLGVYFDPCAQLLAPSRPWENIPLEEWEALFGRGIAREGDPGDFRHHFVLEPVSGSMRYERAGKDEMGDKDVPQETARLTLEAITVALGRSQYLCFQSLLGKFSLLQRRMPHAHLRPALTVRASPRRWWQYAFNALAFHGWVRRRVSWETVKRVVETRRAYIPLYLEHLSSATQDMDDELRGKLEDLEEGLAEECVILFRMMARTEFNRNAALKKKEKDANLRRELSSSSWYSSWWGSRKDSKGKEESAEKSGNALALTPEEWASLDSIFEEVQLPSQVEKDPFQIMRKIDVEVGEMRLSLKDLEAENIVAGTMKGLCASVIQFPATTKFKMSLEHFGILARERELLRSGEVTSLSASTDAVTSAAVNLSLINAPQDESAENIVYLTTAPCYVTVEPDVFFDLKDFFAPGVERSQQDLTALGLQASAAATDMADATAAGIQDALASKKNVIFNCELHGPKIAVPLKTDRSGSEPEIVLFVDLGFMTLRSAGQMESNFIATATEQKENDTEKFIFNLRDVSAVIIDGPSFNWENSVSEKDLRFLDKFASVAVVQSALPGAPQEVPSVQVSLLAPSLHLNFGPALVRDTVRIVAPFLSLSDATAESPGALDAVDVLFEGEILAIQWTGVARNIPELQLRRAQLKDMKFHVFSATGASTVPECVIPLSGKRLRRLRAEEASGFDDCLGIVDAKTGLVALTFTVGESSQPQLQAWERATSAYIDQLTAISRSGQSADSPFTGADEASPTARRVIVNLQLQELRMRMSGRCFEVSQGGDLSCSERDEKELIALFTKDVQFGFQSDVKKTYSFLGIRSVYCEDMIGGGYLLKPLTKRGEDGLVQHGDAGAGLERTSAAVFFDAVEDPNSLTILPELTAILPALKTRVSDLSPKDDQTLALTFMTQPHAAPDLGEPKSDVFLRLKPVEINCSRFTVGALMQIGDDLVTAMPGREEQPVGKNRNEAEAVESVSPVAPLCSERKDSGSAVAAFDTPSDPLLDNSGGSDLRFNMEIEEVDLQLLYEACPGEIDRQTLSLMEIQRFKLNFESHSSGTFKLNVSLGNARVSDCMLPLDHPYRWPVDLKDHSSTSLIDVEVVCYKGCLEKNPKYDYQVIASLHAVRIVFLNRFLTEILDYVSALMRLRPQPICASADLNEEGRTAQAQESDTNKVKLKVQVQAPVICVPKSSSDMDSVELNLGLLELENDFTAPQQHGDAVCIIEETQISLSQIQAVVTVMGQEHAGMVHQSHPIVLSLRRPLFDRRGARAQLECHVNIPMIRAEVSEEEYNFMVTVAQENMSEAVKTPEHVFCESADLSVPPPPSSAQALDRGREFSVESADLPPLLLTVSLAHAELELFSGNQRENPLTTTILTKLWLLMWQLPEGGSRGSLHIPELKLLDKRPGVPAGQQSVLSTGGIQKAVKRARGHQASYTGSEPDPSMLVLNWSQSAEPSEMSIDLKIQEPTLFVSMGFVLGLCNFFGIDSLSNSLDDKLTNRSIFLGSKEHVANSHTELGPAVQLFADSPETGMFTFNGNGHDLVLPQRLKRKIPLIVVGCGKTLRLKNVSIVNAGSLASVLEVLPGGKFMMQPEDGVTILEEDNAVRNRVQSADEGKLDVVLPPQRSLKATVSTVGMALLFKGNSNEVLSLQMGLDVDYASSVGKDTLVTDVRGLQIDLLGLLPEDDGAVSYNGSVLDKCDVNFSHARAEKLQEIALKTSDMNFTFSTSALNLISAVQKDLIEPVVRTPPDQCMSFTTRFKELCVLDLGSSVGDRKELLTFWRPITAIGYGSMGDCMTVGTSPPGNVATISKSYGLSRKPVSFRLLWHSNEMALWLPEPPTDYVCLGLAVTSRATISPSSGDTLFCVHKSMSVEAKLGEAFRIPSEGGEPKISWLNFRQVCNSAFTFAAPRLTQAPAYEIRAPLLAKPEEVKQRAEALQTEDVNEFVRIGGKKINEHFFSHSTRFFRVWWNRGSKDSAQFSFWRPLCSPGYRPVGDCACPGYHPPLKAVVLQDVGDGCVASPVRYDLVWQTSKSGVLSNRVDLTIWKPVPPPGYVALGFIARPISRPPSTDLIFCVHKSLCEPLSVSARPLLCLASRSRRPGESLNIWRKDEAGDTFTVSLGQQKPSPEAMLCLKNIKREEINAEEIPAAGEELVVKALLGDVSCLLCDTHGLPIVEAQVNNINCVATQPRGGVGMTATFGSRVCNFNRILSVWEPVMDRCEWYLKFDQQPATDLKINRGPANSFQIASVSEVSLTVSHTMLRSVAEFTEEVNKVQNVAKEDSGAKTVTNLLGVPLFVKENEPNGTVVIEVPKGASGFAIPAEIATAQHHGRKASVTPQSFAPLRCHVCEVHGIAHTAASRVACEVSLLSPNGAALCVRSRATIVPFAGKMVVDETLVLPLKMVESGVIESVRALSVVVKLIDVFTSTSGSELAVAILPLEKVVAAASGDHKYSTQLTLNSTNVTSPDILRGYDAASTAGTRVQLSLDISGLYECLLKAPEPQSERSDSGSQISLSAAGPWVPLHEEASVQSGSSASTVTPVMLGAEGLILESCLENGQKRNKFRSLVQVCNSTNFILELCACIGERSTQGVHTVSRAGPEEASDFVEIFENQVFSLATGWAPSSERLRAPFTDSHGKSVSCSGFPKLPLPHGWEWTDSWQTTHLENSSSEGWWFGANFREMIFPPPPGAGSRGVSDTVRSRRYVRYCRRAALADEEVAISFAEEGSEIPCGRVRPGDTLPLPRTCCLADSNISLRVRPLVKETEYSFSHAATSSLENVGLILGQLQDGTHLQVCAPGDSGEHNMGPFWVSLHCEGEELPLWNGQDSVTDWKINIQAPLVLENKLNSSSDFIIWEHPKVLGARVDEPRQVVRGVVESRGTVSVHAADPRRALSLTWVPSGCRAVEGRLRSHITYDESEVSKGTGGAVPQDYVVVGLGQRRVVLRLNHLFGAPLAKVSWPLTIQVWTPVLIQNNTAIDIRYVVVDNLDHHASVSAEGQHLLNLISTKPGDQSNHERSLFGEACKVAPHTSSILDSGSVSGEEERGLQIFFKDSRCLRKAIPLKVSAAPFVVQASLPSGLACAVAVEVGIGPVLGSLSVVLSPHVVVANRTLNNFDVVTMGENGQRSLEHEISQSSSNVELQWPVFAEGSMKMITVKHPDYGTTSPFAVQYPGFARLHVPFQPDESSRTSAPPMVLEVECVIANPGCMAVSLNKVLRPRWLSPVRILNYTALDIRARQFCSGSSQRGDVWSSVGRYAALPFTWSTLTEPLLELELDAPGLAPQTRIYVEEGPLPAVVTFGDAADGEESSNPEMTSGRELEKGAFSFYTFEVEDGHIQVVVERSSQGHSTVCVSNSQTDKDGAGLVVMPELLPGLSPPAESLYEIIIDTCSVSLVDERPEELVLLTLDGLKAQYGVLGCGTERAESFALRVGDVQLDDMRTLSHYPVILGVNRRATGGPGSQSWLNLSVRRMLGDDPAHLRVPFAGIDLSDTLMLQVHEPLIWRLMRLQEALTRGSSSAASEQLGSGSAKVAEVDPQISVNLMYLSGLKVMLGFRADPLSRPSQMGLAQGIIFNLVNFDGAPLSLMRRWEVRRLVMQRSRFAQLFSGRLTRDVASQLVNVLRGVSLSGAAAGALSSLSGAAAAISLDGDFRRQRSKGGSAPVEGFSDGVTEGAMALGKGLASGVSGLFLKPVKGLKDGGAAGLAEGLAKGVMGVVAKPLSGGLDLVSKSVQGAAASIEGLGQIATGSSELVRRRLPRAVRGDRILREYSEWEALGQWMLKTAEWGGLLSGSAHDPLVKEKRRYVGDVYEFHMRTAEPNSAVIVSDRRVLFVRGVDSRGRGERRPVAVKWEVRLADILSIDLLGGGKSGGAPAASSSSPSGRAEPPHQVLLVLGGGSSSSSMRGMVSSSLKRKRHQRGLAFSRGTKRAESFRSQVLDVMRRQGLRQVAGVAQKFLEESLKNVPSTRSLASESETGDSVRSAPLLAPCVSHELVWESHEGLDAARKGRVTVWRPTCPPGYFSAGDVLQIGSASPSPSHSSVWGGEETALPVGFSLVWRDNGRALRGRPVSFWMPVPPEGYVALGAVAVAGQQKPPGGSVRCLREDLAYECQVFDSPLMRGAGRDREAWPVSAWPVDNTLGTFLVRRGHDVPESTPYDVLG